MADRSVFRTAVRTPSAQMDADFSTLHAPEAAGEVVDEGCRRVRERGQIDIVRCLAPRTPDGEPWISKPSLRPVSTRRTSAWQIVEWPILGAKRTFNKTRWPVSRHVSFVGIWKLEVAPDYRSCKRRGYAPLWAFQLLHGYWLEFDSGLAEHDGMVLIGGDGWCDPLGC
jgi:hypothetical protein